MAYETLLVEKKGATTVVTLNRPEKLNAMNGQMMGDLSRLMIELRQETSTRFIILTGAGRAFSAGADFGPRGGDGPPKPADTPPKTADAPARDDRARLAQLSTHDLLRSYQNLEQVTIAAVNGYCLGAGLVFAMESDFLIAAEDAILGVPEANLGIFYSWGSSARLNRLVGPMWAKHMIMTCENITAQQALAIGLAVEVVPGEKLMDAAFELVDKIAGKSPLAIRLTKKLVNAHSAANRGDLWAIEPELMERFNFSPDPAEGARAFRERRQPRFE